MGTGAVRTGHPAPGREAAPGRELRAEGRGHPTCGTLVITGLECRGDCQGQEGRPWGLPAGQRLALPAVPSTGQCGSPITCKVPPRPSLFCKAEGCCLDRKPPSWPLSAPPPPYPPHSTPNPSPHARPLMEPVRTAATTEPGPGTGSEHREPQTHPAPPWKGVTPPFPTALPTPLRCCFLTLQRTLWHTRYTHTHTHPASPRRKTLRGQRGPRQEGTTERFF